MGFWSNIFAPGEEERSQRLDSDLRTINTRDYAPGGKLHTPEHWEVVQEHLEIQERDTAEINQSIHDAFDEGFDDGAANIRGGIGGVVDKVFSVFKIVPWQIWLIAGVALFFWLGGGPWLARKSKGAFAK